ncbi:MAG: riboflavin synthase [Gemmatimonadota bacterium]
MFTGIVQAVGIVLERVSLEGGLHFRVGAPDFAVALAAGQSVAVDGVCHTVTRADEEGFEFESIRTTLSRTTLGEWRPGRSVNLEPALATGERFGGHLMQGHVDGIGRVLEVEKAGETTFLRVRLPAEVARLTVPFGSLALDGVSLTVNGLRGDVAELAIIPYTWSHTALSRLTGGDTVNIEADLIGKYVDKLLRPYVEREATAAGSHPERG